MNLYYELLQYPVFSMKEVNALYSSERTARAALGKLLKEDMVLKIRNGLYTCMSGEMADRWRTDFRLPVLSRHLLMYPIILPLSIMEL